jgi:hypothetical protein
VHSFDKTPNRIVASVVLFLGLTFIAAQNVIEESRWAKMRRLLRNRHGTLQSANGQRKCKISTAPNKQMNMIRHDRVAAKVTSNLAIPQRPYFFRTS